MMMMKLLLIWVAILTVFVFFRSQAKPGCLLFNFGDSNSDTGSSLAMTGLGSEYGEGRLFFHRPTGRISDGRLIIDFMCQNASLPLLSPYMRPFDGDFNNGVNFAFSGAMAVPVNDTCFSLPYQIQHFKSFRSLIDMGCNVKIDKQEYQSAIYLLDIGQNDLTLTLDILSHRPYNLQKSIAVIPSVIAEIKTSIETLYMEIRARKFWVHNTGPLGCLPTIGSGQKGPNWELDALGCVTVPNDASKEFNTQLYKLVEELRTSLPGSTIVYVDIYSLKHDLFLNHAKYGFKYPFVPCINDPTCVEGSKYIVWEGTHYTELANSMVASKQLTGNYSDPPIMFADLCNAF